MQTLRIRLPGNFYDSQIYDKNLYLWCMDGSIMALNWESITEKIKIQVDATLRPILQIILEDGKDLYHNPLMKHPEVKCLINSELERLSRYEINLTARDMENCKPRRQDNRFPFPHSDIAVHEKDFYIASQEGISVTASQGRFEEKFRPNKISDIPSFSIDISQYRLAIASGDSGLFYHWLKNTTKTEPDLLSKEECNLTRWMYPDIFMSSYTNLGTLAHFKKPTKEEKNHVKLEQKVLSSDSTQDRELAVLDSPSVPFSQRDFGDGDIKFLGTIPSEEIFRIPAPELEEKKQSKIQFVWGIEDKIYWAREKEIEIINYKSSREPVPLGTIKIENLTDEIISADSSFFGMVLEMDTGLLVIDSRQQSYFIENEPVNWRVFPKSKNYIHHLHVIYDDYMDIYIFTHDYFVDQKSKKSGICFS